MVVFCDDRDWETEKGDSAPRFPRQSPFLLMGKILSPRAGRTSVVFIIFVFPTLSWGEPHLCTVFFSTS